MRCLHSKLYGAEVDPHADASSYIILIGRGYDGSKLVPKLAHVLVGSSWGLRNRWDIPMSA